METNSAKVLRQEGAWNIPEIYRVDAVGAQSHVGKRVL